MTTDQALELLWQEVARSSQSRVAERVGVSTASITRWKQGVRPEGKSVELLLKWAQALPAPAPPPDVLDTAIDRTHANLKRLAEIRGYAQAVLSMLHTVAAEQQKVVDFLDPWANEEETAAIRKEREEVYRAAQVMAPGMQPPMRAPGPTASRPPTGGPSRRHA